MQGTKQYIFLSSSRVYADSKEPIHETSERLLDTSADAEFLKTDEYSLTKARQEDILKRSGFSNWSIIRPYITYSERRLQLGTLEKENWLYRAIKGRTIVFSKDISKKFTTLTYGYNVAQGIAATIGKSDAMGEAFHITQAAPIKWEKVLEIYVSILEKHLGRKVEVKLLELEDFLSLQNATYQVLYDRMYDRLFDSSKIKQLIDTKQFLIPQEGLALCLKRFLERPSFRKISWVTEARTDKLTKERTRLNEIQGLKNKIIYLCVRYLPTDMTNGLWSFITRLRKIIRYY